MDNELKKLKIFNTLTRQKEEFIPHNPPNVTMYNCGLTVYDRAHIGNLRAFTMADIIRRTLEYLGFNVIQVQNFTDVGHETLTEEQKKQLKNKNIEITDTEQGIDRLEKTARSKGISVWEVAEYYIKMALQDFSEMNFLEPHYRPRATQHIQEQIELIKALLNKGYAYFTDSAIYYDVSKFEDYWKLAGQELKEKIIAAREEIEKDPQKKNPFDFRLWQFNRPDHTMQWDFHWEGQNYRGYPGWHIECSAMAYKYLGQPIDIHTGGVDHITVHHPNEIAQSEPVYGKPFVKYWYHCAFVNVDGKRMGKSLGNAYNLDDIKKQGYEAMDLRYLYMTVDFRKPQNFTWEALRDARNSRKKIIRTILNSLKEKSSEYVQKILTDQNQDSLIKKYKEKFTKAITDSFNTPKALAVLWEVIESELNDEIIIKLVNEFDKVLGINLINALNNELLNKLDQIDTTTQLLLEEIIQKRNEARHLKDYKKADQLREQARKIGFELIDTPKGTVYKRILE